MLYCSLVFSVGALTANDSSSHYSRAEASKNYINFWSFKDLADFWFIPLPGPKAIFDPALPNPEELLDPKRIDDPATFNFSKIQPGDIIFVRKPYLFLHTIHPHIKVPYVIITHGHSPDAFNKEYLPFLDESTIIAWFTIHAGAFTSHHEKLFSLPLGIRQWPNFNKKPRFKKLNKLFTSLRTSDQPKKHLVYMNFLDWTDPERKEIRKQFSGKPFCLEAERVSTKVFMQQMASCKFTFAPRGVAPLDTFRIWESLIVGSFPIVKKSENTDMFLYEGLPILFINSWNEITQEFLEEQYEALSSKRYSVEKLYMEYWIQKILHVRHNFLKKILHPSHKTHTKGEVS